MNLEMDSLQFKRIHVHKLHYSKNFIMNTSHVHKLTLIGAYKNIG
jgi:hypothetical protein